MRALIVLIPLALTGCFDSGLDDDWPGPPTDAGSRPRNDASVAPEERASTFIVEYRSTISPGPMERLISNQRPNDLPKFAGNTAHVALDAPSVPVVALRVELDGEVFYDAALDNPSSTVRQAVPLPTHEWSEGVHAIRFIATLLDGAEVTGSEEIRVLFNVTALAPDSEDPHLLWLGTFEGGPLAYHLGDDVTDPADDQVLAMGGAPIEFDDIDQLLTPSRAGGAEPAGMIILSVASTPFGPVFGTAFQGASLLDDGGTPFDASDDRHTYLRPGDALDPEGVGSFEIGLANSVTRILPDGETGLWLATFAGLFHVDHGGTPANLNDDIWTVYESDGRYDPNIASVGRDGDGNIWLASFDVTSEGVSGNTVVVLDPNDTPNDTSDDRWARLALPEGFPNDATALSVTDDLVWIGTTEGLWSLDHAGTPFDPSDDEWRQFDGRTGLLDDDIGAVVAREDGRVWVGAFDVCGGEGGGLMLLDPRDCRAGDWCPPDIAYTVLDGLIDDDISSLAELPGGQVVIGTFNALAAPLVVALTGAPGGEACTVDDTAERNLDRPAPTRIGRDGLSVIDLGPDQQSKSDDVLVNL